MTLSVIWTTNCTYSYEAMYTHSYVTWTIIQKFSTKWKKDEKETHFSVKSCSNEQQQQSLGGKKHPTTPKKRKIRKRTLRRKKITKIITCIRRRCLNSQNDRRERERESGKYAITVAASNEKKLFSTNLLSSFPCKPRILSTLTISVLASVSVSFRFARLSSFWHQ